MIPRAITRDNFLIVIGSDSALGRGGSLGAGGGWVGPIDRWFRVEKECIRLAICLFERKALITSFVVIRFWYP